MAIAERRSNEEVWPEEGKVWFRRRPLPALLYLVCERNIIPVILPEGRTQPIYFNRTPEVKGRNREANREMDDDMTLPRKAVVEVVSGEACFRNQCR